MKRYLIILLLLLPLSVFSQSKLIFTTTSYAFARIYDGIYKLDDWEECKIRIIINTETDIVTIYGSYNNGEVYQDEKGGKQIKFYVIDQDRDRGSLRLRIEKNGNSQIYIDFNDCAWCYNVIRVN